MDYIGPPSDDSPDVSALTFSQVRSAYQKERAKRKQAEEKLLETNKRLKKSEANLNLETTFFLMMMDAQIKMPDYYGFKSSNKLNNKSRMVLKTNRIPGFAASEKRQGRLVRQFAIPDAIYFFDRCILFVEIDDKYHSYRFNRQHTRTRQLRMTSSDAVSMNVFDKYMSHFYPDQPKVVVRLIIFKKTL